MVAILTSKPGNNNELLRLAVFTAMFKQKLLSVDWLKPKFHYLKKIINE